MIRLVVALMQALPVQHFPTLEHPGTAPALRSAADAICDNPAGLDRNQLLARENRLAIDAARASSQAAGWLALGCARAALDGDGALSHDGPLMVVGNSWATGSERALLKALAIDPRNGRAAEALATLALDDLEPDDVAATASAIVKATAAGVSTPAALRACDELALRTGDIASARRCVATGLARGSDSTWHLIRRARLDFRSADTVSGTRDFLAAAGAAHDTAARSEIDWQLQWFLSPDEQATASRIADSARANWIRDRLVERDVRDGQPRGARLAEHFNRLEYALANFRLEIPAAIRRKGGLLAPTPESHFSPDSLHMFCEPGLIPADPVRDYHRWQSDIDDRGVVWLRFGAPEKRIRSSPSCADTVITDPQTRGIPINPREVWYYEIDGKPLLLNFEGEEFDGSEEATRLVTGVLGSYLCDVDALRCGLTQLSIADWKAHTAKHGTPPSSPLVKVEDIEHVRQDDRAYISAATTADDNSVRGERNIAIVSRLHRLWDPISAAPIALITYAFPIKDLAVQSGGAGVSTTVDLTVRQWDRDADRWQDTSVSRHFQIADTGSKATNLVGYVVTPSSSGVSAWSVVATQPEQRRGRAMDVTTAGLDPGPVAISDLVFGSSAQGLSWRLHGEPIPLAPTNAVDRRDTVSMYYQIRSETQRDGLRTTVALYPIRDGVVSDSAALQVTFDQAVHSGINEVAPIVDLSNLDRGSYRVEVRLVDAAGRALVRRRAGLDLR
ncbi:MAG TPA: hypothetical protein VGM20_03685 [Gemmatimonadales bacterium]|jgi:hypothetical protein